jgi:ectoine hydroxylase-related dioxygenase (phytanoyl-CoA dioxygenase family)
MNKIDVDFGTEEAAMQAYFREGTAKALALKNRGPFRFTADGKLDPEIVAEYRRTGFYVFEGAIDPAELTEARAAMEDLLDRVPTDRDSKVDHKGRTAVGVGYEGTIMTWARPLGDPLGGTGFLDDRAPVKMIEPEKPKDLPDEIPYAILSPLQFSEPLLRIYGHPGLLAVAASIHGDDFVPFSETLIIKKPGEGGAFAWHQDGTTHWKSEAWDRDIHGFNYMAQFYRCTAANSVWFVPGSHALGKVDIKKLVAESGGNRLVDAVPLICNPGDVAISNRQIVHGSFPNTSKDTRVSLTMGFHRRSAVLGVKSRAVFGGEVTFDAEKIRKRSEIIGYAIDARRQRFPDEKAYVYRPQADAGERYQWSPAIFDKLKNYHLGDLFI